MRVYQGGQGPRSSALAGSVGIDLEEALDGSALTWTCEPKVKADRISESVSDHFPVGSEAMT